MRRQPRASTGFPPTPSLPSLLAFLLSTCSSVRAQTCYYPDGSAAVNYKYLPCVAGAASYAAYTGNYTSPSTANHTACCLPSESDRCLSSGLCDWPDHYVYRGACTDPTWKDPACGNFCSGLRNGDYYQLVQCVTSQYCCSGADNDRSCCTDGSPLFAIDGLSPAASAAAAAASSGAPTGSATASGAPSSSGKAGAGGDEEDKGKTKPVTAGIIAGVVGALAIFAIAGIVLLVCMRRKKKRAAAAAAGHKLDGHDGASGGGFGGSKPSHLEEHQMHTPSRPSTSYTHQQPQQPHEMGAYPSQNPYAQQPVYGQAMPHPPPQQAGFQSPPPAYQSPAQPYPPYANPFADQKRPGTAASSSSPGPNSYQGYYQPPPPHVMEKDSRPGTAVSSSSPGPNMHQGYYQPPPAHVMEKDSRPVYGQQSNVYEMAG